MFEHGKSVTQVSPVARHKDADAVSRALAAAYH
jgi:hypothetical protein